MAIRVRKLAKELKHTPAETLGLLHHLGFPRYKTPNDMVSDPIARKVRQAARQGVRAAPVAFDPSHAPSARPAERQAATPDLMSQLVPGVVPQGASAAPASVTPSRPVSVAPRAAEAPPEPPAPPPPAREEVAAPRPPRSGELEELRAELRELRAERDALRTEVERLQADVARDPEGTTLRALLEHRGLRGADEGHRALAELAVGRSLAALLEGARLGPRAAAAVEAELAKLVLVDGGKPEGFDGAAVAVAPDRAEAPGHESLARRLGKISEQMLLNGCRRLRFVGVAPRWHAPIRSLLDRRVEVRFAPGGERDADRVRLDADNVDVVVYASVPLREGSLEGLTDTRVVAVDGAVGEVLDALLVALQRTDEESSGAG